MHDVRGSIVYALLAWKENHWVPISRQAVILYSSSLKLTPKWYDPYEELQKGY